MQSHTFSSTLIGIEAKLVRVEVAVSNGLPGLLVVGLPDAAVNEAGARVRAAVRASGFDWPPRRVVVNLSPADLRKHGSGFDLAIALGLLEALGEIPARSLERCLILGELSLDGTIRAVRGSVPTLCLASESPAIERVLLPADSEQLPHIEGVSVLALNNLAQAVEVLSGRGASVLSCCSEATHVETHAMRDLKEVKGQSMALWGLELAAAGGHHLMMVGPPGCGKSLLASCLPGILPPLTQKEWLEVASVASVCQDSYQAVRPFRSPGQGTSAVAMLGGQQPGEVTRAHHGVLFLDEFPEFRRDTLEGLRQVMEEGQVTVIRAKTRVTYPASFTLIAAMNPCPCGHYSGSSDDCVCTEAQRLRYSGKLSGPIRDRFDLLVAMERPSLGSYLDVEPGLSTASADVRERVVMARQAQLQRGCLNRELRGAELRLSLALSQADEAFCQATGDRLRLSVRALEKWLKVARTAADLEGVPTVTRAHLLSALTLRGPETQARLAS